MNDALNVRYCQDNPYPVKCGGIIKYIYVGDKKFRVPESCLDTFVSIIAIYPLIAVWAIIAFYSLTTGHGILYTLIWSIVMGLVAGLLIIVVIRYLILTRYSK